MKSMGRDFARTLPAAVRAEKHLLPASVRAEVEALNGARPLAFSLQLLGAWTVIIATIVFAIRVESVWVSMVALLIVATRQNVLGLLVHEQAHLLGYRGRFGDLLVNLLAAYPLVVLTVEGYAQVHLAHHREYFTDGDPDFRRKSGPDWKIPMSRRTLVKLMLSDLVGINTLKLVRGKRADEESPLFARRHRYPRWIRPLYFAVVASLLTLTGTWGVFLLYWLLPILTITQVIIRWGALCEHKYNLPGATVAASTPMILPTWWERLLLPNLNFTMHPYHHYFPGISFSKLPMVHSVFDREGLVDRRCLFDGYLSFLSFITKPAADESSAVDTHP